MSKSKGDFLTLQSLVDEGFDPLDYRYLLLGAHYRSQLVFSWDSLRGAQSARKSLLRRIRSLAAETEPQDERSPRGEALLKEFREHLADDLNTPRCLADLWSLLKDEEICNAEKLSLVYEMDGVLGFKWESLVHSPENEGDALDEEIQSLIQERLQARADRNFARADQIRDELKERGISLIDGPDGTTWERI